MTDVEGTTEESLSRSVSDLKSKMDRLNYVLREECLPNMKICTGISFELCGKMRTKCLQSVCIVSSIFGIPCMNMLNNFFTYAVGDCGVLSCCARLLS